MIKELVHVSGILHALGNIYSRGCTMITYNIMVMVQVTTFTDASTFIADLFNKNKKLSRDGAL